MSQYYSFQTDHKGRRSLKQRSGILLLKEIFERLTAGIFALGLWPLWLANKFKGSKKDSLITAIFAKDGGIQLITFNPDSRNTLMQLYCAFVEVFLGRLALVGPAASVYSEEEPLYSTFDIKPAIYSTYSLKKQANLTGLDKDYELLEYIEEASLISDLGIFIRSLLGHLLSSEAKQEPVSINMLDVEINNLDQESAMDWLLQSAKDRSTTKQLAFVNPDCLNIAFNNSSYKEVLVKTDRIFADGIGVHLGCNLLNVSMKANLNGTDLFPLICEMAQAEGLSIYLLGGKPGVTDTMVEKLNEKYSALTIAGHRHGYFDDTDTPGIIENINRSNADILFVAFGAPKQDLWIFEHKEQLNVGLAMGVGGLFDFVSQRIARAPMWMREIGLEWVYRLMQEPGRMWRRYIIGNPLFLYRVWRQKRSSSLIRSI